MHITSAYDRYLVEDANAHVRLKTDTKRRTRPVWVLWCSQRDIGAVWCRDVADVVSIEMQLVDVVKGQGDGPLQMIAVEGTDLPHAGGRRAQARWQQASCRVPWMAMAATHHHGWQWLPPVYLDGNGCHPPGSTLHATSLCDSPM